MKTHRGVSRAPDILFILMNTHFNAIQYNSELIFSESNRKSTGALKMYFYSRRGRKKFGTLHEFACHPCAGAMLIFSVSFQF